MATMFVAGELIESGTGEIDEILNPATGEVVDTVPRGSGQDVTAAVDAAQKAMQEWSRVPPARRGELLAAAADRLEDEKEALSRLLTSEQGKPLREAGLEINRLCHTLRHYAGLAKAIRGGYVPLGPDRYAMIIKRPIGICGAIVPWNFPVSLMGNKLAPALLSGNAMVIKPAGTTPLTAIRAVQIISEDLPPGTLNVVTGPGSVVGQQLIEDPRVRKIGFTGATDTGRGVMAAAAASIKRVTLELGGSDPMIVCDDADIDAAVSAASVGRFFNCGQACLAIKRLYVFESIADEFTDKLIAKVQKLRLGNGLEKGSMIGPLHTASQRTEVEEQIADAVDKGATILTGGSRPDDEALASGHFYLPTLLADVDESSRVVQEEVFGPALPIMRVADLDEGIAKANDSIFGLGSSVWTRDLGRASEAAHRIDAGYTWINSAQIIFDELPFGGLKQSGVGKEHGEEALDYYQETKSVVVSF